MPQRRVVLIERIDMLVCRRPAQRHGRWLWFELTDAPELADGGRGWYQIARIPGAPPRGRKWRVVGPTSSPYVTDRPC